MRAGCSPDFMHYRPDTQVKAQFDKKLLVDFVKHHKNIKQDDGDELKVKHRGLDCKNVGDRSNSHDMNNTDADPIVPIRKLENARDRSTTSRIVRY